MKIGIAADHAGFELKNQIKDLLENNGYKVKDYGAHTYDKFDDYPDLIAPLARGVGNGEVDRGIAVCGSGVGACIVANKVPGARACLITETYSARQGVEHDDMNMICIGGRVIGIELVKGIIDAFLSAKFTGEERHQRRLDKVLAIEAEQ